MKSIKEILKQYELSLISEIIEKHLENNEKNEKTKNCKNEKKRKLQYYTLEDVTYKKRKEDKNSVYFEVIQDQNKKCKIEIISNVNEYKIKHE